jgi:hypothetical protein
MQRERASAAFSCADAVEVVEERVLRVVVVVELSSTT